MGLAGTLTFFLRMLSLVLLFLNVVIVSAVLAKCPTFPHFTAPGHYCLGKNIHFCLHPGELKAPLISTCHNGCTRNGRGTPDTCSTGNCKADERYVFCANPMCFESTCASPVINPQCQFAQTNPYNCKSGCACKPGKVRNLHGACVNYLQCPEASRIQCPSFYTGFKGQGAYCLNTDLHFCQFPGQNTPPVAQYCPLGCTREGPYKPDKCVEPFMGNQSANLYGNQYGNVQAPFSGSPFWFYSPSTGSRFFFCCTKS